ncbi:EF-hand calcium-binding domain-containing protein 6-like [Rhinoraja longicauda]
MAVTFLRLPQIGRPRARVGFERPLLQLQPAGSVEGLGSSHFDEARAATAHPMLVARASWPPGLSRNNDEKSRAHTAMGRFTMGLPPTQTTDTPKVNVLIREKLYSNFPAVRHMFMASDPKGRGIVSKEALTRILWNLCGYLNTQQVNDLLVSLGIAGVSRISLDDFVGCFLDPEVGKAAWMKNVQPKQLQEMGSKLQVSHHGLPQQKPGKAAGNANNCLNLLKQKVQERGFSLNSHFQPLCLEPEGVVTVEQLKQAVSSMGLAMTSEEVDNLWVRVNKERKLEIPTVQLLNELGISGQQTGSCGAMDLTPACRTDFNPATPPAKTKHVPPHGAVDASDDMDRIFRDKLDEAGISVLHEFAKYDKEANGLISKSGFRHALVDLKIAMFVMDLEHLLSRFNLRRKDGLVDYVTFVKKLQSRSTLSLFHKLLPQLNASEGGGLRGVKCNLTSSEATVNLLNQCHRLYLQLLTNFRKAEVSGEEAIAPQAFKEILEKYFQIDLSENQLHSILTKVGDPQTALVSYSKFLSLFQDRPSTGELKDEVSRCSNLMKNQNFRIDRIRYLERFSSDWARYSLAHKPRPLQEVRSIVWNLLQKKFRSFCKVYVSVCINDDCTADKEKLDSVLLRMNVILLPMELEKLWYSLPISYPVEAISLRKFLRHFSRLKKMKDSGLPLHPMAPILSKVRRDVVKHWAELKSILKERDPHGTGLVPFRDIQAICMSLRWNLLPTEMDKLCAAFDLGQSAEFHYIPFLKSYTKKQKGTV